MTFKESTPKQKKAIPLVASSTGQWLRIHQIPHGVTHAQFVRMGLAEGAKVKCLERLPGGTIVLQRNRQHIAIGHQLARQILVVVVEKGEEKG
jgi:ferrous iron transport protein A